MPAAPAAPVEKNSKLIFLIDHTTDSGISVGEGFFVGNNMKKIIEALQLHYKNSCFLFEFSIYIVEIEKPFDATACIGKTYFEPLLEYENYNLNADEFTKIQIGTNRKYANNVERSFVYFPRLPADFDLMQTVPLKLYLQYNRLGQMLVSTKNDDKCFGKCHEFVRDFDSTTFYCNNYY